MKKLKKLLKMGTFVTMATLGGCSSEEDKERQQYFGMTKEEFIRTEISKEEYLSRIQYHKTEKKNLVKKSPKQKD